MSESWRRGVGIEPTNETFAELCLMAKEIMIFASAV
jgi:hypothetical protein